MKALVAALLAAGCGSSSGPPPITQAACGTTIDSRVGAQIVVSLDSTYWMFQAVSDPTVLEQSGTPTSTAGNCPAGVGCGTVRAVFEAIGAGQASIQASRSSCGEASACGPGQGDGICTITVDVAP
jgi:hypothetical protein